MRSRRHTPRRRAVHAEVEARLHISEPGDSGCRTAARDLRATFPRPGADVLQVPPIRLRPLLLVQPGVQAADVEPEPDEVRDREETVPVGEDP